MRKFTLTIVFSVAILSTVFAQNLVTNPSAEADISSYAVAEDYTIPGGAILASRHQV